MRNRLSVIVFTYRRRQDYTRRGINEKGYIFTDITLYKFELTL